MMKTPTTLTGVSSLRSSASLRSAIALASAILASAAPIQAASVSWNAGGGADLDWSNSSNWGGLTPSGNDLVFGTDGATTSPTTVTSVVDGNVSANSLIFQYNSTTAYQVLQIDDGATLSLSGTANVFTVGGYVQTSIATTKTVIAGHGSLVVDQVGGTFLVNNLFLGNGTTPSTTELDASGLRHLDINLGATGALNIGVATSQNHAGTDYTAQGSSATFRLGNENTITSGSLNIGSNLAGRQVSLGTVPSSLILGQSNQINVDTINVAKGTASSATGVMQFATEVLGDASLKLRGADSTGRVADIFIGSNTSGSGVVQNGNVDVSGGEIDALVTNLTLGMGASSSVGRAMGSFTMDRGTFDVTNVIAGYARNGAGAGISEGSINVAGGSFIADSIVLGENSHRVGYSSGNLNISGLGKVEVNRLVMGNGTNVTGTSIFSGNIRMAGGSLTMQGNIAAIGNLSNTRSTLVLQGGVLDMSGYSIEVSTLQAEAGVLQNVGAVSVGGTAGLLKTGEGVLRLTGNNTFTGGATVSGGVLLVDDGAFPTTGDIRLNTGGAVAFNTTESLQTLISQKIASGATGAIALLNTQSGESLDFSASGANLTGAFLGAVGDVRYTGEYQPGSSAYRLGGGTGTLDYASDITGSSSVVVGGKVRLSGNNSYSGGTTIANGTLKLSDLSEIGAANGSLTLNAGTVEWLSGSSADITAGRSVTLEAGGGTFSVARGNTVSLTNGIAGAGALTKVGLGTVTLQGQNSYTGATTVRGGRLVADLSTYNTGVINASSALVLDGSVFELKGKSGSASTQTLASLTLAANTGNSIVLNPSGATSTVLTLGNSWTRNAGSSLLIDISLGGSVASAPIATVATPTATSNILGYTVVKDATGIGFGVVQNNSVVRYTAAVAFPQGAAVSTSTNYLTSGNVNAGAARTVKSLTIDTSSVAGSLDMGAAGNRLSLGSGGLLMYGGNDYHFAQGTLGANNTELIIHQYGTGTLTISGVLSGGTGSLTKAGSGLLVLAGTSIYTGATAINDGTLRVDGAIGASDVTVGNATFTVNGSADGSVSMSGSSRLNGTGSVGGNVNLAGNALLSSAGTLKIGGGLNVQGRNNLISSGTLAVGGITVVHADSTLTVDGVLGNKGGQGVAVSGLLNGSGAINKSIWINDGGNLSGNLTVTGRIGGSGSINPGNSPGLLAATEIDASQGLSFNFEFNALNGINWSSLENDVLRLTSGDNPFSHALDSTNTVSLYLSASVIGDLVDGGTLIGGFYADSGDFLGSIENANYRAFYEDAAGSILYNGVTYSEYTLGVFGVSTVQNAHFAADGYITQFQLQVIPEPSTIALFSAGFVGLALRVLRRKKA